MSGIKRSSYPSKQLRSGPAPLASFEDLSDEIESPEDAIGLKPLDLTPGNETEDDSKTYSDGATPSTPRVLAQTPSTPLALEGFSIAGTPDSFGPGDEGAGAYSPPDTPSRKESAGSSHGSLFSPHSSPLFGRRATPDPQAATTGKSMELLDDGQSLGPKRAGGGSKSGPGTPSPRSARKFFTMSFFKPREDKTPSPTASPKSPRRMSPVSSPRSPGRRTSPFAGLFKGGGKEDAEPSSASPTKKKGHFTHFLRVKDEKKTSPELGQAAAVDQNRKEGRHGVFATLFRRADHKEGGPAKPAVSPMERGPPSLTGRTPDADNWSPPSAVQGPLTPNADRQASKSWPPVVTEHFETSQDQAALFAADDHIPSWSDDRISQANGLFAGAQGMFESSQDVAGATIPVQYDPKLRLGSSPSTEVDSVFSPPDGAVLPRSLQAANQGRPTSSEDEHVAVSSTVDDKMSPESEVEMPEADPAVLKVLKKDEPEAETLLREDSFEADEFPPPDLVQAAEGARQASEKEVSRHREKMAAFRTNPVNRPRSTAPISFASLEAYINTVGPPARKGSPDKKLKVILPGEEFEHKSRAAPKKAVYKSWFEFCELGLQSPRSRRREARTPSSAPASSDPSVDEDERRTESLDLGFVASSSDRWPSFEPRRMSERNGGRPTSSDSSRDDSPTAVPVEDCKCECHDPGQPPHSNSSCSSDSSPTDFPGDDVPGLFLRDEEVEPLVKEVDSVEDFLAGDDVGFSRVPDCVSSAMQTVPARPVSPENADPPDYGLDEWDAISSRRQAAPVNGNVMDLLASLPSPKQERHHSWFAANERVPNGRRRSGDSAGSDDPPAPPLTSPPALVRSTGGDV